MIASYVPFLILILNLLAAFLIRYLWKKDQKIASGAVLIFIIFVWSGLFRFNSIETDKFRADMEDKSFDRWNNIPEDVIVEKESYETRMQERHDSLRKESDELIKRYLGEENEKNNIIDNDDN